MDTNSKNVATMLQPQEVFVVPPDVFHLKLEVEWVSFHFGLCDLDVFVLIYDEKSRFVQKLNVDRCLSSDKAIRLEADTDLAEESKTHKECVYINLEEIDIRTAAAVIFIDGGPRNFQYVESISILCSQRHDMDATSSQDIMKKLESALNKSKSGVFIAECRVRKDYQALAAMVLYRDGWHSDDRPKFSFKANLEPVFHSTTREKDDYCQNLSINTVPCLLKYRARLFPSVQSICAALSSTSLPKLKRRFLRGKGLPKSTFTEVLFQQLYETKPELLDISEASYTVAMLFELFGQIDFNGDGAVDWDEFTTFCIHTGLIGSHSNDPSTAGEASDARVGVGLNQYIVEYKEDTVIKDTILSSYSPLVLLRHAPLIKRLLVVQEKRDSVLLLSEHFKLISTLNPSKVLNIEDKEERFKIYDVCYIPMKDMYAMVASDHSITVYREHTTQTSKNCTYSVYNRVFHTYLHVKIAYAAMNSLLCTVDSNNTIYGWHLDGKQSLFELSRHKALVTDLLAIDKYNLFATCSLDKRIVVWSQTTRRVKGVLLGHKRGISRISYGRDTLLSSGFECEARTWDMEIKEPQLILRGHRLPISDSKIMCREGMLDNSDLRAITVDDSGEFRLWSIGVTEKKESNLAETLQIFSLNSSDKIQTKFSYVYLPFDKMFSNANYSNIVAGSSKLIHFVPEKNTKEFLPPNCMLYSEVNSCLITAVGRSIYKYDMFNGGFHNSFEDILTAEITCFANDGKEGRRLYLGFSDGTVILMNFASGQILSRARPHNKLITALKIRNEAVGAVLYVGSADGKLRTLVEHGGKLICHSALDETFPKDEAAIAHIHVVPEVKLLLLAASSTNWGGWNCLTLKKHFTVTEVEPVTGLEVLGGGGAYSRAAMVDRESSLKMEFEKVVTIAVCTSSCIRIYAFDTLNVKAVCSHALIHSERLYFSNMVTLKYPQEGSMNYCGKLNDEYEDMIVASSDEGWLIAWSSKDLRESSLAKFYDTYPHLLDLVNMLIPHTEEGGGSRAKSATQSERRKRGTIAEDEGHSGVFPDQTRNPPSSYVTPSSKPGSSNTENNDGSISRMPSVESELSMESTESLFSMTSKMGVVVSDMGDNMQAVGAAKTVEVDSPLSDSSKGPSFSPLQKTKQRKHLHRINTICTVAISVDDVLPSHEDSSEILSVFSWKCHDDVIQSMVALREDCCLVTNSLDGFHRVWNLHKECLGELALPNLTDSMQEKQQENRQSWKFVLEKIPVLPIHEKVAADLVTKITEECGGRRRRVSIEPSADNSNPSKPLTKKDKQRCKYINKSRSSHSFGSDIIKNLNEETTVDNGSDSDNSEDNDKCGATVEDASVASVQSDISSVTFNSKSTVTSTKSAAPRNLQKSDSMSTLQSSRSLISARSVKPMKQSRSLHDKKFASCFGHKTLWNDPKDFVSSDVLAFSESSISNSHHDGFIDEEGHAILRKVQKDRNKLEVYRRSEPSLRLKNVGMCTSIEFPGGDMSVSELSFGSQKDMYKNANGVIGDKLKLSDTGRRNARHALARARIKNSVSSVGSLVRFEKPPQHEIQLPPLAEQNEEQPPPPVFAMETSRYSRRRGAILSGEALPSPSAPKKLDHIRISRYIGKIMDSDEGVITQWEKDLQRRKDHVMADKRREKRRRKQSKPVASKHTMASIERRLRGAIVKFYADRGELVLEKEARKPTARDLLPSYTIGDLTNFLDAFHRADVDFSGALDINEWVEFLSADKNISEHHARTLFNNVDMSANGILTVKDLVPIVFGKADKSQQELIYSYLEDEISRSGMKAKESLTSTEVETLFECYDSEHIGYVSVSRLREKIKGLRLPVAAYTNVVASIQDYEDDELVNVAEFLRIFQTYLYVTM